VSHPTEDRNFRLPSSVRPLRYRARLHVDPGARTFRGRATIEIVTDAPAREVILHAADLEIESAAVRARAGAVGARARSVKESDTVVLALDGELPAGAAELDLAWSGRFNEGLRGLYSAGPIAVTQFEAADARRVFPCFDEPGFKATWRLEVDAPAELVTLSNSAVESERTDGGRRTVAFRETPPLPTYLVALAIGRVEGTPPLGVRGVPVRTFAVPEKLGLTAFGQEVAVEVLPRLEDYFGLPYAFGKLDQIGIPDFEAGAMENAGLVTYREVALLLDPATASLPVKKRVAEVVTHELAHMWFGNWVTMRWWDDLWLNEAFATWMAFKVVDAWKPEWRVWLEFDGGKAAALHLDALASTHPIRSEVKNADEATESFDVITYEKGGAVLRMIESWLGEAPFRDGIRLYMRRHGKGNAVADDLWGALGEASRQPVQELANAWIGQGGFPLVEATRRGRALRVAQRRFFSDPDAMARGDGGRWPVPLVVRWRDGAGVHELRHLLRAEAEELTLAGEGEIAWACANAGATGFYRVAYDAAGLAALAAHLPELAPPERISLLADGWALVRARLLEPTAYLDLLARFGGESDDAVLEELVGRLAGVEHRLDGAPRAAFQAFVAALLGPSLRAIGWDAPPAEPDGARLRRASLVRALGLVARDVPTVREGQARLERFLRGDGAAVEANLHDAVVAMSARAGDAARFDLLRARYEAEQDPAFRRRYLLALAQFEDPRLAARAEELSFSGDVPLQDAASFTAALLANRTARASYWSALRARWGDVEARLGGAPMLLRRVVEAVGALPGRRHLEEAEQFFAAHPLPPVKQAVAQTLERMRQDVELWERITGDVERWVSRR
jgi:puromycin-sensitive aminopeptidase